MYIIPDLKISCRPMFTRQGINVKNFNSGFNYCRRLKLLPDVSLVRVVRTRGSSISGARFYYFFYIVERNPIGGCPEHDAQCSVGLAKLLNLPTCRSVFLGECSALSAPPVALKHLFPAYILSFGYRGIAVREIG